jgi:uncharacterized protein YndB with AHSA1/START domain
MALHGTFAVAVETDARPDDVHAALVQGQQRCRWLRLPGKPESAPGVDSALDYAVGVSETLRSSLMIGEVRQYVEQQTHVLDVVPDRRLVLSYRAVVDDVCRWASLVTIEVEPTDVESLQPGTRLTWTEQYTFLVVTDDGADDVAHLRGGTRLLLNGLAAVLGALGRPAVDL